LPFPAAGGAAGELRQMRLRALLPCPLGVLQGVPRLRALLPCPLGVLQGVPRLRAQLPCPLGLLQGVLRQLKLRAHPQHLLLLFGLCAQTGALL
jgi:hypothetical protein